MFFVCLQWRSVYGAVASVVVFMYKLEYLRGSFVLRDMSGAILVPSLLLSVRFNRSTGRAPVINGKCSMF